MAEKTIVQDVIDIFRGAGFEVREYLGTGNPFTVVGSLDSAAILLEKILATEQPGVERFHWTRKGMVLDKNGFYIHRRASDDLNLAASQEAASAKSGEKATPETKKENE